MPTLTRKNAPDYADRVNLIKKIKLDGSWRFAPVVPEANGGLKGKVRINGTIEVHTERYLLHRVARARQAMPSFRHP